MDTGRNSPMEGSSLRNQDWVEQRIQESVNSSLTPMQTQLAAIMHRLEQLAPPTNLQPAPATPSTAESLPGTNTPLTIAVPAVPFRKPLPNPPKYGGARKGYATWAQQMRDKIALDAGFFPNNRDLWYLINSCLEEKVQQVVATFYVHGGDHGRYDPEDFMRYLDRTYQDPNIQSRAAMSLRSLRQRDDQPLSAFLPKFEQSLAEAGAGSWPDGAKIVFLENALNARLQRSLVTAVLPSDDYHSWLSRVQEIAGRLERLEPRRETVKKEEPKYHSPRAPRDQTVRDHEGDSAMTGVGRVHKADSRTRGGKSTEQPRPERRCFHCDQTGHLIANCPSRTASKKKKTRPRLARAERPAEAESGSDSPRESDGDEESGKD